MSSENEHNKLLIIGTLIGLIGSVILILGIVFSFISIDPTQINILDFAIIAWTVGILFICLITFFGSATPKGLVYKDVRPSLLSIALLIFTPTRIISPYNTPLYYLLERGIALIGAGTAVAMTYLIFVGIVLLMIAFFILTWIFLWKMKPTATDDLYADESTDIGFIKFIRIVTSIVVIVAGVGIFLGFVLPISTDPLYPASLLMSLNGSALDFSALAFLIYILGLIVTAGIMLLGNFGVGKIPRSELPLVALIAGLMVLPGYSPTDVSDTVWSTPIYKLLEFGKNLFGTVTFMGWLLLICVAVLVLAFMIGVLSYFLKTAATFEARTTTTGRMEPRRRRKTSATSALEDYAATSSGDLASQLSTTSGPPTGTTPVATSGPPTGPPTGTTAQPDKPTCPFCSKQLRYIEEYQRWYCDSCAQYV
ncbi:MAG: hypothetical protein FK733_13985 [Asgard group archaeon]|nr:hypothetical protein [Asgard group archaeon]